MGILKNLTEEYFGILKREEDLTIEEQISRRIDYLIDKWVEENNVQFINTGKKYGRGEESKEIEIANMDFLAKSDEDIKIDYTPIKNMLSNFLQLKKSLFITSLFTRDDTYESKNTKRILEMSKKYQLIKTSWLEDALRNQEYDYEKLNGKKIIKCNILGIPTKILGWYKGAGDYRRIFYYGEEYTVNDCIQISFDSQKNKFRIYNIYHSSKLDNYVRFRLCKRYTNS